MLTIFPRLKLVNRILWLKIMVVFSLLLTLSAIVFAVITFKTIRTFIYGESMWSRSQANSSFYLSSYIISKENYYLEKYEENMNIIRSDHKGLIEIKKHSKITPKVIKLFSQGMNNRNDIETALPVFSFFMKSKTVQDMITEWEHGNRLAEEIDSIAQNTKLHFSNGGSYSQEEIGQIISRLEALTRSTQSHSLKFSQPLMDLARQIENIIGAALFTFYTLLVFVVSITFYSIKHIFEGTLKIIKNAILDAVSGKRNISIDIPEDEDIEDIGAHLNLMLESFQRQLKNTITAKESEGRLAILADAMPHVVCIKDRQHNVEFLNIKGRELFNIKEEKTGHININNYVSKEDIQLITHKQQQATLDKLPYEFEVKFIGCDWYLCRFEPIYDKHGEIIRWYGSFTSIKVQKMHEQELYNAVKIRDEFLSIASHELKTPISALLLQNGMRKRIIEKNNFSKITEEYFKKIISDDQKQLDRIIRLVDDMLDITRIQQGKISLVFDETNVNDLIIDSINRFQYGLDINESQIHYTPEKELIWKIDAHKIEQVLINLISNAQKYGRGKDIVLKSKIINDQLEISITDSGEGISEKDKLRIFDLFERVSHTSSVTGMGLGLFIVNQIILSHRGEIRVDSEIDKGSTFTVCIPRLD